MRKPRTAFGLLVLASGLLMNYSLTWGKTEYTKKEKKPCTFCHKAKTAKEASAKDLTEAGKYYEQKKSLDGFTGSAKK